LQGAKYKNYYKLKKNIGQISKIGSRCIKSRFVKNKCIYHTSIVTMSSVKANNALYILSSHFFINNLNRMKHN